MKTNNTYAQAASRTATAPHKSKTLLSLALLVLGLAYAASHAYAAIEVAKVDDDELTCEQISAEVKKMEGIAASGSADAKAAAQRKERLEALAKATKCKLK